MANERVLGGGGSCTGGAGYNFLYFSGPAGNGRRIACDTPNAQMVTGVVYAVCGTL